VKTRVGYAKESLDEWLPVLLGEHPVAVTLHLRTRNALSLVPADWEWMKKAVAIRDRLAPEALLIGNGDIRDLANAKEKIAAAGCDGAMIGRGMFGNPWVFAGRAQEDTPLGEKLDALVALAADFEKLHPAKNFAILKKHVKAFVNGYDGAAKLREMLMDTNSAAAMYVAMREHPGLY
jgi:tRNA-dihydrouridine synthase